MADNNFKSNGESALLDLRREIYRKLTADKSLNLNVLYLRNKDIKALSLYQKLEEVISLSFVIIYSTIKVWGFSNISLC
ncbi:MAG: hypothetical protein Ct9H300mP23_04490 [Nitrospinota bacterium]|nr:MAG: hypothetical protein Ct9H300mP23_04490 [Nitrospinota bacterium]